MSLSPCADQVSAAPLAPACWVCHGGSGVAHWLWAGTDPVLMARAGADLPAPCSNPAQCVLQSFKVPLNGTFIFLPAEGKVLLNSQAGKPEFTQMEQLVQTTEQIPATNQFHTSKERKKGMAEAGQSKQALENSSLLVGIFSCYFFFFSHSGSFGDLSIQQSSECFCIHMK